MRWGAAAADDAPIRTIGPAARVDRFGLSTDIIRAARARLRQLALTLGVVGVLALALIPLGLATPSDAKRLLIVMAWTAVLWAGTVSRRVSDAGALLWGLVSQVGFCSMISFGVHRERFLETGSLVEATWVCVFILAFPLFVPLPARHVAAASSACSLTVPLGVMYIGRSTGTDFTAAEVWTSMISPLFCSVLATFGAWVVHGMGVDATRAKEMGAYRLEEPMGSGGMGEVWRATHAMLKRPAAVKLVHPEALARGGVTREVAIQRLQREAQATAQLHSPHTVEVYDYGVSNDGAFYYVMELLDGEDLQSLVERDGPMPVERVVWIGRQICHSLAEAHAAGLVHRDIKPANVILCRYGGDDDVAKVLDFGLVRTSQPRGGEGRLTGDGVVAGTPAYLPPEMAVDPDAVCPRTDIYALGCVLYWMTTGAHVFPAETAMQAVMGHVQRDPAPPSTRTELPVPAELDALILDCLAKAPSARPESASAVSERLHEVPVPEPWSAARARAWWKLRRGE